MLLVYGRALNPTIPTMANGDDDDGSARELALSAHARAIAPVRTGDNRDDEYRD
jgi:hypothetical protein